MLLQASDWTRYFIVYVMQTTVSCFLLVMAYKILRRHRNRLSWLIGGSFLSISTSLLLNSVVVYLKIALIVRIIYFFILFFLLFSYSLILLFSYVFYKKDKGISTKKIIMLLIVLSTLAIIVLSYPEGYVMNQETNWEPVWSQNFVIILCIYTIIILVLPFGYISIKVFKELSMSDLKKKWAFFTIGIALLIILWFGGILFIVWHSLLFRTIWAILLIPMTLSSGLLIYFGIGTQLDYKNKNWQS